MPTPDHIIEKQLYNLADRLERVEVNEQEIGKYLSGVSRKLEWLSEQDLLKRVLSLEFNRLLDYYKDAPVIENLSPDKPKKNDRKQRGEKPSDAEKDRRTAARGMARVYVNVGKRDGFYAGNLIDILNHVVPGQRVDVGRIDLMPGYSLFDVKKSDASRVVQALKGSDFYGKRIHCEQADAAKDYARASARKMREDATGGGFEAFSGPRRGGSKKMNRHKR